ncbi:unnamed protein product [Diatraea saccharalis]|uniref:Amino acid transporter transmembrane domain-containing protein n=1 Tax=Diatraea saccharalis TaxID=40085 RepID=A0A9N9QKV1_9NEOP|nr:unnamed protein product [Diatraea saccharalis]
MAVTTAARVVHTNLSISIKSRESLNARVLKLCCASVELMTKTLIALAMMFTYPLQFYVPVRITWPALRSRCGGRALVAKELGYRALLVLLTFILAESIPQLGLFISLVGAVSSTALALVFPPLIELVMTSQKAGGVHPLTVAKDIVIILLGLFIFVTGTYESVASIVRAFKQ